MMGCFAVLVCAEGFEPSTPRVQGENSDQTELHTDNKKPLKQTSVETAFSYQKRIKTKALKFALKALTCFWISFAGFNQQVNFTLII